MLLSYFPALFDVYNDQLLFFFSFINLIFFIRMRKKLLGQPKNVGSVGEPQTQLFFYLALLTLFISHWLHYIQSDRVDICIWKSNNYIEYIIECVYQHMRSHIWILKKNKKHSENADTSTSVTFAMGPSNKVKNA